jgi:hypothetical protein
MEFANANKIHRKSGGAQRTLFLKPNNRFSASPTTAFPQLTT